LSSLRCGAGAQEFAKLKRRLARQYARGALEPELVDRLVTEQAERCAAEIREGTRPHAAERSDDDDDDDDDGECSTTLSSAQPSWVDSTRSPRTSPRLSRRGSGGSTPHDGEEAADQPEALLLRRREDECCGGVSARRGPGDGEEVPPLRRSRIRRVSNASMILTRLQTAAAASTTLDQQSADHHGE
jgi:hypothetical protein